MAIIDVVKHENADGELCFKFDSNNLRLGTPVVVHPAQVAFFVKGGSICDEFTTGTYRIETENIPILNKIINLPYGGQSPFQAEVWFISLTAKLDLLWGTPQPIQIEDPRYHIIVPIRAHGQYGIRVTNPRLFIETLIGSMPKFTSDKIEQFYKGRVISVLNTLLAQEIVSKGISILDINTHLMDMSAACNDKLNSELSKYGVSIVDFSIISITFPEDDESVVKLKDAKDLAARLAITGKDVYQMERSFDVLEKAAANEGAGGSLMSMGVGLGAGVGVGNVASNMMSQYVNANPPTPEVPNSQPTWFILINNQQIPNRTIDDIRNLAAQGLVSPATLVWTPGMSNWVQIASLPQFATLFNASTPPSIPQR